MAIPSISVKLNEGRATAGFGPDDARLLLPVVIWVGLPDWLLAAACLGAPAFALIMGVKCRTDLRKP